MNRAAEFVWPFRLYCVAVPTATFPYSQGVRVQENIGDKLTNDVIEARLLNEMVVHVQDRKPLKVRRPCALGTRVDADFKKPWSSMTLRSRAHMDLDRTGPRSTHAPICVKRIPQHIKAANCKV